MLNILGYTKSEAISKRMWAKVSSKSQFPYEAGRDEQGSGILPPIMSQFEAGRDEQGSGS